MAQIVGHSARIQDVAYRPDGAVIATSSRDGTIRFWNASDATEIGPVLAGHVDPRSGRPARVYAIAWFPSGDRIASAGQDGTLRIWDVTPGSAIGEPFTGTETGFTPWRWMDPVR
jgi:WD40 repeat protein